jgi:hypothetical protein
MFNKFRRYWKAFFILVRYNEYVFYIIEQECFNQSELKERVKDNEQYVENCKLKKFAQQNYADVQAGLWREGTN